MASVPDGEGAAAVVHEPGLVEAVAPRGVLERVLADRRPEARRHVPLRGLARDVAAGDLAHVERLAPVLDREVAARARVVGEDDVARGVHAIRRGAHPRVDLDPAVLDLEARRLREARARLDP